MYYINFGLNFQANNENTKEKLELLEHLMAKKADPSLPTLSQVTKVLNLNQASAQSFYVIFLVYNTKQLESNA